MSLSFNYSRTNKWLPANAAEFNPVEQVWNRTKDTDLAN